MRMGLLRSGMGFALFAAVLASAPKLGGSTQEAPPPVPSSKLEERIALLENRVAEQQAELDRLGRVAEGLSSGATRLTAGAEQALLKGFISAGPNPDARTELLNGMTGFAESVKRALAGAKSTEPSKPKK